jgi:hypothetical protein
MGRWSGNKSISIFIEWRWIPKQRVSRHNPHGDLNLQISHGEYYSWDNI